MRKFLLSLIFFATLLLFTTPRAFAVDQCPSFTQDPTDITSVMTSATWTIKLPTSKEAGVAKVAVVLKIKNPSAIKLPDVFNQGTPVGVFTANSSDSIEFSGRPSIGGTATIFLPVTYTLELHSNSYDGDNFCSVDVTVKPLPINNKECSITMAMKKPDGSIGSDWADFVATNKPFLKASSFAKTLDCRTVSLYHVIINNGVPQDKSSWGQPLFKVSHYPQSQLESGITFEGGGSGQSGTYPNGTYEADINDCGGVGVPGLIANPALLCSYQFTIQDPLPANAPPGGNCVPALATGCKINSDCCGGGTCIGAKALPDGTATGGVCTSSSLALDSGGAYQAKDFPSPTPACQPSGDGYLCTTAIGNIQTSAQGFVQAIMDLVLSIVGGIAVLLIIISGYRLMVSQGNPEGIKNAKDQLTAAIIGLLFVIFSLVILQIIGYNILGLPGFKP